MSLFVLLLFIALLFAVAAGMGKAPTWAAVFVLVVALLVQFWR